MQLGLVFGLSSLIGLLLSLRFRPKPSSPHRHPLLLGCFRLVFSEFLVFKIVASSLDCQNFLSSLPLLYNIGVFFFAGIESSPTRLGFFKSNSRASTTQPGTFNSQWSSDISLACFLWRKGEADTCLRPLHLRTTQTNVRSGHSQCSSSSLLLSLLRARRFKLF